MTTTEAGKLYGKKFREIVLASQRGDITPAEANQKLRDAQSEYTANLKATGAQ